MTYKFGRNAFPCRQMGNDRPAISQDDRRQALLHEAWNVLPPHNAVQASHRNNLGFRLRLD